MREIRLTVPAVPVPQPRARATSIGGSARMHEVTSIKQADGSRKPHAIVAFKATVRLAFEAAYSGPPHAGPVTIGVRFLMPRPKSMIWKTRPMPRVPHARAKCDIDNLAKAVMDALTGLAWVDDDQIWSATLIKQYAAGDEQPHCELVIRLEGGV